MEIEDCFFDTSDYQLTDKKLGSGSFGVVYVVKNKKSGELSAAKILQTNGCFSSHDQKMFLRESLILNKIRHETIVNFQGINFHSFQDPNILSPTILTEYYPNGSLKVLLDKEKQSISDDNWTPTKKYICMLGISEAMRFLHMSGIIHRDLKPENVLVDSDFYPKVCDFGLSRYLSEKHQTMTGNIGTPMYMAPELFGSNKHYGPEVDVYSFSIIMYEIVAGKEPFGGSTETIEILRKIILGERPEIPADVPEKMKDLLSKCWSHNASDRPTFDEIFSQLSSDFSSYFFAVDEDEINEYIARLKEKQNQNETENDKLKEELKMIKEELKQKEDEISKKEDEINKKDDKINNLKADLSKKDDEINKKEDEINKKEDEINNLKADLNKKDDEINKKDDEINKKDDEINNLKADLNKKDDEIRNLQLEMDKLKNKSSISSDFVPKRLHFKICEAQNIHSFSFFRKSNPYVTIRLKSQPDTSALRTRTIQSTNNPVWNEEFELITSNEEDRLIINMFHENEKLMDEVEIPVNEMEIEEQFDHRNIDIKLNGKSAGKLMLEIQSIGPIGKIVKSSELTKLFKPINWAYFGNDEISLKIFLIGPVNSGKTVLILRFITNELAFPESTVSSAYAFHYVEVEGHKIKLNIYDQGAGSFKSPNIYKYFLPGTNGILVNYDVTCRYSLEIVNDEWIPFIKDQNFDPGIPIALVGNRIDEDREVSYEEGEQFATKNGWKYFETSSKQNIGVNEPFMYLTNKYLQYISNKK